MTRDDVIRSTAAHIRLVGNLMVQAAAEITRRAVFHDASKWSAEEWPAFEASTPKLGGLTYGSPAYKAALAGLGPALKHHQANNRHHPEFHPGGIDGMTLIDLLEMMCDWKAATERHDDGSILRSLAHNENRFNITPQLMHILTNTVIEAGWADKVAPA